MEEELLRLLDEGYAPTEVYDLGLFVLLAFHLVVLVENDIYVSMEEL